MDIVRKEFFLRLFATVFLVLTAVLVGFDTQTKVLFYVHRKATFKYLNVLRGDAKQSSYKNCWLFFFLDQVVVYTVFAANTAAIQASAVALFGVKSLQWMKLCNKFPKFCIQIASALIVGYVAVLLLAVVSSISAYQLFRLYSPKHFLKLKRKLNDDDELHSTSTI
ncbi:CASP-like protein 2C1 isoform X2 [Lycium ferocissimum]|uniref:CASP-like protein 2C1 isoform X2 n=1 Tax=Lycium ferocissimum TaxID=112874 RepID=UPI00281521C6|nr:CASP-like protein 2C1 isoform X2 [Lycium ferocissimum]